MYICSNNIMSYIYPTTAKNKIMDVTQRSPGLRQHCLFGGPPTLAAVQQHIYILYVYMYRPGVEI